MVTYEHDRDPDRLLRQWLPLQRGRNRVKMYASDSDRVCPRRRPPKLLTFFPRFLACIFRFQKPLKNTKKWRGAKSSIGIPIVLVFLRSFDRDPDRFSLKCWPIAPFWSSTTSNSAGDTSKLGHKPRENRHIDRDPDRFTSHKVPHIQIHGKFCSAFRSFPFNTS